MEILGAPTYLSITACLAPSKHVTDFNLASTSEAAQYYPLGIGEETIWPF